jgi:hypothetical protein
MLLIDNLTRPVSCSFPVLAILTMKEALPSEGMDAEVGVAFSVKSFLKRTVNGSVLLTLPPAVVTVIGPV